MLLPYFMASLQHSTSVALRQHNIEVALVSFYDDVYLAYNIHIYVYTFIVYFTTNLLL